jgi:uncharacterized protein (TIGR02145 family)
MKQSLNLATNFAMLLMALAMALAFLACEEKSKKAEAGTFTDARDGKIYKTVKIGEQVWMAENLNFKTENSRCYGDDEANCKKYGRLYGCDEERTEVCPKGWHLSSREEWNILVQIAGGIDVAGKKLKSKNGWENYEGKNGNGTDEFGFSALPSGLFSGYTNAFAEVGSASHWWSYGGDQAIYNREEHSMTEDIGDTSGDYMYIRCIQGDGGTASKAASPATDTDYSPALQTHYSKGTLGESGKTRPIEMFFQKVSKNGGSYSISGKSKTNAAEDAFSGTLSISSQTAGGSCNSEETELKGSYDFNEKESKTSGHFVGTFIACEKSGTLSKASFKGNWVKHANGNKTPCEFELLDYEERLKLEAEAEAARFEEEEKALAKAEDEAKAASENLPKTKAECLSKKIGSPVTLEVIFLKSECGEGCSATFRYPFNGKEMDFGGQLDTLEEGTRVSITYQREQQWVDYDFIGQGQWCDQSDNLKSVKILGK